MTWIVETSVAVKWVVAEDGADLAAPFLSGDVVAPDLLRQELANALWKKVRRDEIGKQQAQLGYGAIIDALRCFPTGHLAVRAFDIALRIGQPVYDCLYLALAESLDLMILTVDHKLILACGHTDFAGLLISLEDAARLPQ